MNKQNEIDLHKILVAADSATAAAAKALLDRFRPENIDSLEAFYKSSNALVTGADLASDKSIIRILKAAGVLVGFCPRRVKLAFLLINHLPGLWILYVEPCHLVRVWITGA
ncbi:MAG: hypothetical protein CM1200mP39_08220 [Dehalococcoidia bacterium]|nr:MAG: hypothetical protein CM1200mP39_08220 [Dehalococcoidia bacterium]